MEKMAWGGPKWGREDFFPTNPDLANILGRTDLNFEIFFFFHFLDPKILDFQVPKFWISQKSGFPGLQKIHTGVSKEFRKALFMMDPFQALVVLVSAQGKCDMP